MFFDVICVSYIRVDRTLSYFLVDADNKRLDEWIPHSRMEDWKADSGFPSKLSMAEKLTPLVIPGTPLAGPGSGENKLDTPGGSDRKLTRNLKRRYDEINNVQKVLFSLHQLQKDSVHHIRASPCVLPIAAC